MNVVHLALCLDSNILLAAFNTFDAILGLGA